MCLKPFQAKCCQDPRGVYAWLGVDWGGCLWMLAAGSWLLLLRLAGHQGLVAELMRA